MSRFLFAIWLALLIGTGSYSTTALASQTMLELKKVGPDVYAIFGTLGDRTPQNLGNNANFGFIITEPGIILIDSGGSYLGAQAIHNVIKKVSNKAIIKVINTGGQDHRWLGNDYFAQMGAEIIASEEAVKDHKKRTTEQLQRLSSSITAEKLQHTLPRYADKLFRDQYQFTSGSTTIHIIHKGAAHTPGDSYVWLPQSNIVFSGDIIYTQRMLGLIPVSNSRSWLQVFASIKQLKPSVVIPGHGKTTDMKSAVNDTESYLKFLRSEVIRFMESGKGIENIGSIDQQAFSYLKNYSILKGRNAQKAFEEIEWE